MKNIKLGAAVLNQIPMDWSGNADRIREAIRQAREEDVSLLLLPEMCITGYGCEDMFLSPELQRTARHMLDELAPETKGMAISVGLPLLYRNALYNTAALLVDGALVGFAAKQHLAGDGIHYEPRWFAAWPDEVVRTADGCPLGDVIFDLNGIRIGFEICEDGWAANRPGIDHAGAGVDILLNPSASHFAFGKHETRKRLVQEGSRAFGVTYVYTNLLGNEAGRIIYDGGAIIASGGELIAEGPRFSFQDVVLTTAVIDVDDTRLYQVRTMSTRPDFDIAEDRMIRVDFDLPTVKMAKPQREARMLSKEEEFTGAECLGLFDYLRKSYSRGFVLSLSGGADSTAVACLVHLMAQLALRELGFDGLKAKLAYRDDWDTETLNAQLLTCVYQATEHSSDDTFNSARSIAEAVGATFIDWTIDELINGYRERVETAIKRELTWELDDLTLQNIQARVRGPGVWMLANIQNALLLATSNRSEAAVGYATMDGDTCGGLSPIGGIDKAFLRHWLRWLEVEGPLGLAPLPALRIVNALQPTAELRPLAQAQTDEKDLMPYELLDAVEEAAIRDKKMPAEVLEILQLQYPQYDDAQLTIWVKRFFRLWSRNQWKRERYAPAFHLDDTNLDPKTWCRFPILSSGYRRELDAL
ncbi:MAG: NAD+ synthase (glutamine-hydrolyzing) [Candidatus Omnitrophota bacterium]|jgi:NAD+ synthase (glutamine-hydrolysing)